MNNQQQNEAQFDLIFQQKFSFVDGTDGSLWSESEKQQIKSILRDIYSKAAVFRVESFVIPILIEQ